MPLVSVVVPVYNTGQYVNNCIDSLLKQSFSDIEIILVDDGSTDESGRICDKLAQENENIKSFHQTNAGVSSARNFGIEVSSGDYICFVDSDDEVRSQHIEALYQTFNHESVDIAVCGYTYQNEDTVKAMPLPVTGSFSIDRMEANISVFGNNAIINSVCNKMYRLDVIKKNGIEFDRSLAIGEDCDFNLNYLACSRLVTLLPNNTYTYIVRQKSAMQSYHSDFLDMNQVVLRKILDFFSSSTEQSKAEYVLKQWIYVLRHYSSFCIDRQKRKEMRNRVFLDRFYREHSFPLTKSPLSLKFAGKLMEYKLFPACLFRII